MLYLHEFNTNLQSIYTYLEQQCRDLLERPDLSEVALRDNLVTRFKH
jgi:hypothetical protein